MLLTCHPHSARYAAAEPEFELELINPSQQTVSAKCRLNGSPCISLGYVTSQYLERELQCGVGLEEPGVKLFRECDGLADLAGEHEPLDGLPVAHARQVLVDLLAGAPVESLGGGAGGKIPIILETMIVVGFCNVEGWSKICDYMAT